MEPFEIRVSIEGLPEELKVIPVEMGEEEPKYQIHNDGDYLGSVWPECVEAGICWFSSDELAEDTTLKIGEAIERVNRPLINKIITAKRLQHLLWTGLIVKKIA